VNTNIAIFLGLAGAAVAGTVVYLSRRGRMKRADEMARVAAELRLAFTPEGDETTMAAHAGLHLFSHGRSKKVRNLMRGSVHDSSVSIFDYQYTVGGGKNQHTYRQTVVSVQKEGRSLPAFSMRPENLFHKLGSMMGYQDIDFESNPVFSKKYLLRGPDEAAIRSAFTSRVLTFLEAGSGLCVEADGRTIIVFRHSSSVKPEALREFMETGIRIAGLFQR
jgi:hypothetical protein